MRESIKKTISSFTALLLLLLANLMDLPNGFNPKGSFFSKSTTCLALSMPPFFSGKIPRSKNKFEMYETAGVLRAPEQAHQSLQSAPAWKQLAFFGIFLVVLPFQAFSSSALSFLQHLQAAPPTLQNISPNLSVPALKTKIPLRDFIELMNWSADGKKNIWGQLASWHIAQSHGGVSGFVFWMPTEWSQLETVLLQYEDAHPSITFGSDPVILRLHWIERTLADPQFLRFNEHLGSIFRSEPSPRPLQESLLQFLRFNEHLRKIFRSEPPPRPLKEALLVWIQPEARREAFLHVIDLPDFQKFRVYLKARYGINPNEQFTGIMSLYLSPNRDELYEASRIELFGLVRHYFSDPALNSLAGTTLTQAVPITLEDSGNLTVARRAALASPEGKAKIEAFLKSRADTLIKLRSIYHLDALSVPDYLALFRTSDNEIQRILANPASAWSLAGIYSSVFLYAPDKTIPYRHLTTLLGIQNQDSLLSSQLVTPFYKANVTPAELDRFLSIFGTTLNDFDFAELPSLYRTLNAHGKTWKEMNANQDFKNFIRQLLTETPAVNQLLHQHASRRRQELYTGLCAVYLDRNQRDFELLNNAIRPFAPEGYLSFELNNASLKIQTFREFQRQGLTKLRAISEISPYQLQQIQPLVINGTAKALYTMLTRDWNLQFVDTRNFFNLLQNPYFFQFYMNGRNAQDFQELRNLYHVLGRDEISGRATPGLTLGDLKYWPQQLLEKKKILLNASNAEFLRLSFPDAWSSANGTSGMVLAKLPTDFLLFLFKWQDPNFILLRDILEKSYGFKPIEIRLWLKQNTGGILSSDLVLLRNAEIQSNFHTILAQRRHPSVNPFSLGTEALTRTIALKGLPPNTLAILGSLEAIGIDTWDTKNLGYIFRYILPDPSLTTGLQDENFLAFYRSMHDFFYGQANDLEALAEMRQLYFQVSGKAPMIGFLKSRRFQHLVAYMRDRFGVTQLHPSSVQPLIALADHFDSKAMDKLIAALEKRGETVSANDIVLLQRILEDTRLHGWAMNRANLEHLALEKIYSRPVFPRRLPDELQYYQTSLNKAVLQYVQRPNAQTRGLIASLQNKIVAFKATYTERPSVAQLPTLLLIRALLLEEALERPEVLERLGSVVQKDLQDTSTEYGGLMSFEGDHLNFAEVKSHSEDNGAYQNEKNPFFTAGIFTFHLHALSVGSLFEGPSGMIGLAKGDIGVQSLTKGTDAVVTPLGYAPSIIGPEDRTQLRVNVDIYTVVTLPSGEKRAGILDLGAFTVPQNSQVSPAVPTRPVIPTPHPPAALHEKSFSLNHAA
jgi:hypothetical protein